MARRKGEIRTRRCRESSSFVWGADNWILIGIPGLGDVSPGGLALLLPPVSGCMRFLLFFVFHLLSVSVQRGSLGG